MLKMNKILGRQISTVRIFFCTRWIRFSYFILLLPNIFYFKKSSMPQDTAYKALQFTKNSYERWIKNQRIPLVQKNSRDWNLSTQNFVHFQSKKCNCKVNGLMQIVELFMLHLGVNFVFLIGWSTVGAISVAPLCILSCPFELNNVDLIWLYILVAEIEHYLYTPVPYGNSRNIK